MLERVQRATQSFLNALGAPSRSRVEERIRAQQHSEAQAEVQLQTVHQQFEAAFAAWCADCGAPQYFLPWLDRCIEDARLASRNKLSSPYENSHLQGMEDGLRLVKARFASSGAGNTVKSARPDPEQV